MKRESNVYTGNITAGMASARIRVMDTGTVPEFEVREKIISPAFSSAASP